MLIKYEASLPSWTIVMAQYTQFYNPNIRHILRIITFLTSCVTLSMGLYDLYKHFPGFGTFFSAYATMAIDWLEG